MTQPLTLLLYERLLPGGQLVNRLQDLGYRVQVVAEAGSLGELARREKPLLLLADLESSQNQVCHAIASLKKESETSHIPIIAFGGEINNELQEAARAAGADLVVTDNAILAHLSQFLDQALHVE